ncbi:class I SAM-dependent methyltransferase [Jeotgalibacillus malaysiensis]|uniref:class I SAM-dependent methyltransferase n=1 Tax=Jeotgalibacillus malaysiensis TaxID=1508404 RepID=UPI00384C133D
MIITTSGRPGKNALINLEKAKAHFPDAIYAVRNKKSIRHLIDQFHSTILVAGENRFELFSRDSDEPFFYHPNSASFRIKRLIKGEQDPLVSAAGLLPSDRFLDCTAGIASDALVVSWYCTHSVTAVERSKEVAFITGEGLKSFQHNNASITAAMRKINLIHCDAYDFLKKCTEDEYDVIYFDPMFSKTIQSEGISGLKQIAEYEDEYLLEAVREAKRVARRRIVFKDHFRSKRFIELGFEQIVRPSTKQHYGVISLEKTSLN